MGYTCEFTNVCVYHLHNLVQRLGACKIHVCSNAMVLLLLIHWLIVLSLFGGVVIGPCFAMHYLVAFHFCDILAEEEIAGCFT